MKCPRCNAKMIVVDSVHTKYGEIYRRRRCESCKMIIYTAECEVIPDSQFMDEWYSSYRKHKKKEGTK